VATCILRRTEAPEVRPLRVAQGVVAYLRAKGSGAWALRAPQSTLVTIFAARC